jgi:hypothetical protein
MRGVNNGLVIVLELAGMHDPDPGAEIYRCRKLADLCPPAAANNVAQPMSTTSFVSRKGQCYEILKFIVFLLPKAHNGTGVSF